MWISRQIVKPTDNPTVESGRVTLSNKNQVEAVSTGVDRNLQLYAPYGYTFSLPSGVSMLLAKSDGEQAGIGALMQDKSVKVGEIKITAQSGAYIHLKNDGSVVINGLEISKYGEIYDY